jgi:hypothetical protein
MGRKHGLQFIEPEQAVHFKQPGFPGQEAATAEPVMKRIAQRLYEKMARYN